GLRRAQERREECDVAGVAEVAERNVPRELGLALRRRVQALVDLLAVHAAGRQAVDRDTVAPDLAREPLRPGVHAGLGRHRGVDRRGLGAAGDAERAAPAPLDHAW